MNEHYLMFLKIKNLHTKNCRNEWDHTLENRRIQDMLCTINNCLSNKAPISIKNLVSLRNCRYNFKCENMLALPKMKKNKALIFQLHYTFESKLTCSPRFVGDKTLLLWSCFVDFWDKNIKIKRIDNNLVLPFPIQSCSSLNDRRNVIINRNV